MNVIGEAFVRVRSLGDTFTSEIESSTAPGFKKVETEAEDSGALAGSNLRGGVKGGLADIEKDAEESGGRAGGKLSTALNDSLGSSVSGGPLSKLAGLLGATGPIGLGAIAVGGVLVGLGAFALKMGADMSDADAKISASADISKGAAEKIGDAFLDTAGKFTFSGIQMANAYAPVAAQLGAINGGALSAAQALDVMSAAATLAEATGTSLDGAAKDLTMTLQTFKLPVSDAAFVTDNLYNVAKTTGTGIDQVSSTFQKLKTSLGAASPDIGTLSGLIADLAANGEGGRKSISAMAQGLTALAQPTAAQAAAQKFLGISTLDANGNFVGMQSVINQLQPKLAGLTPLQQQTTLAYIVGSKAAAGFAGVIHDGSKALDGHIEAMAKTGSAQKGAAATTDTFSGSMAKARAGVMDIAAKIGEKMMPEVDKLGAELAKVVSYVVAHWPEIQKAISIAWDIVKPVLESFINNAEFVIRVIGDVVRFVADVFQGKWGAAWREIQNIFGAFVNFIRQTVQNVLSLFHPVITFFESLGPKIAGFLANVVSDITKPFATAASWIYNNVITPVIKFFTALPAQIVSALGAVVTTIWQGLVGAGQWINTNVIQPTIQFFTHLPAQIVSALGSIVTTIWQGLVGAAVWIDTNVITPVVNYFTQLPGRVVAGLGNIVGTIFGGLTSAASWVDSNVIQPVVDAFGKLPGDIASAIVAAFHGAVDIGKDIIDWIKKGLNDAINWYNSHRPSLFGVSLLPPIPTFAQGGYVTSPTIALIGEAGPEYVIPESQLRNPSGMQNLPNFSGGPGSGVGQIVSVTVSSGAVVITVPQGTSTTEMQEAVNTGFVTLGREVAAGVSPLRGGGTG